MRTLKTPLLLALLLIASCSKKIPSLQVPDAVQASFNSRYGAVTDTKWELASTGFIAVFAAGQHPTKAYFDSAGNWDKTETELKSSELPLVIMKTVTNAFAGNKIKKALQVERSSGESTYILSLKMRNQIQDIEFSATGVILNEK
jgi:hypothetical protein